MSSDFSGQTNWKSQVVIMGLREIPGIIPRDTAGIVQSVELNDA